jgi:hypothetical protein
LPKPLPISVRAYATLLNVDEKAVRKAIEAGKIQKGYDAVAKKINPAIADKEWGFQHKIPKPQSGVSKAKAAAKMADSKPEQEEGQEPAANELIEDYTYEQLMQLIKLTPTMSYSTVLEKREILDAALAKMKLEEMNGQLVRKTDVDKQLFALGDTLKKSLLTVPARCISDIRAAPTDIEAMTILTREMQAVLKQFADMEYKN